MLFFLKKAVQSLGIYHPGERKKCMHFSAKNYSFAWTIADNFKLVPKHYYQGNVQIHKFKKSTGSCINSRK